MRRWNTDPIEYEWQSPYVCFNNDPIYYADPLGLEGTNGEGGDKGKNKDGGSKTVKDPKGNDAIMGDNAEVSSDARLVRYPNGTVYTYSDEASGYIQVMPTGGGSNQGSWTGDIEPQKYEWAVQQYYLRSPTWIAATIKYPEYKKGIGYQLIGELASGKGLSDDNPYIWSSKENEEYSEAVLEIALTELAVPVAGYLWAAKGFSLLIHIKRTENLIEFSWLARFAKNGSNAAEGGITVLGHYPEYVKLAESIGARRFQIPTSVWNKMSAAEQWIANTKFLDRMILRGDKIRLATPLNKVKPGSFFEKELNYLFDKGYKVSSDGLWLIK